QHLRRPDHRARPDRDPAPVPRPHTRRDARRRARARAVPRHPRGTRSARGPDRPREGRGRELPDPDPMTTRTPLQRAVALVLSWPIGASSAWPAVLSGTPAAAPRIAVPLPWTFGPLAPTPPAPATLLAPAAGTPEPAPLGAAASEAAVFDD